MHSEDLARSDVDPRVERSRQLVLTATVDLLGEVGYGPLAIETVAARSGVAKSTIYRHWSGKDELVAEAFARLRDQDEGMPPPGPVRSRLAVILREMARSVKDPTWHPGSCLAALIDGAERSDDMAKECARVAEERARPLVRVLEEAVAAGELPEGTDVGVVADALVGPIMLRRLFHRETLDPSEVPELVDQILPTQ